MTLARIFRFWAGIRTKSHAQGAPSGGLKRLRAPFCLRVAAGLALAWLCVPGSGSLRAQDQKAAVTENQVKAAYLTKLGRFVEQWSARPAPSPEESFDICVLGRDPFGPALDAAVKDLKINGSPLATKRIARAQDALGCRVLFIAASEESQLGVILATLGTAPVLTVGDISDFVKRGGMIQFVLDGNNVKFEISLAASRRAGLKLSSELLKVARVVRKAP